MEAIIEFDGKTITMIEESNMLTGGRAELSPPQRAYTQVEIERCDDDSVMFSLSDNITDVDGHWSGIALTESQFSELKQAISKI